MKKSKSDILVDAVLRLTKSCPSFVLTKHFLQKHLYSLAYVGAKFFDTIIEEGIKKVRFTVRKRDLNGKFTTHIVAVEY